MCKQTTRMQDLQETKWNNGYSQVYALHLRTTNGPRRPFLSTRRRTIHGKMTSPCPTTATLSSSPHTTRTSLSPHLKKALVNVT